MKYLLIALLFLASCSDGDNRADDKTDNDIDTTTPPPTDTLGVDTSAVIQTIYRRKGGDTRKQIVFHYTSHRQFKN